MSENLLKDDRFVSQGLFMFLQEIFLFHLHELADAGLPSVTAASEKLSQVVSKSIKQSHKISEPSATEKQFHGKYEARNLETHLRELYN